MKQSKGPVKAQQTFCNKFQEHKDLHIWFCFSCANKKLVHSNVIFCALCNKQKYQDHKDHKPMQNCRTDKFKQKVNALKNYIVGNQEQFIGSEDQYLAYIIQNTSINAKLNDTRFKKWLIHSKFWQFKDPEKVQSAQNNFKLLVKTPSAFIDDQTINDSQKVAIWEKLNDKDGVSIFDAMYKQAEQENEKIKCKKTLIDLVIEAYSCFDIENKKKVLEKIDKAINQYPNQSLLYIIKLYLIDLHSENFQEWQPCLAKVQQLNTQLKDSPLCLYIESHKYWRQLKQSNLQNTNNSLIKFVDLNTGNIFVLQSAKQYTQLLSKAIVLLPNPSPILQAARGLGYLAQSKYSQALRDFKGANKSQANQSIQMNEFYTQIRLAQDPDTSVLLQGLENKTKHFIINAIKFLKKQNLPQQIIRCCNQLIGQENQNNFVLIQLVKALLRVGQIQKSDQIKNRIPKQKLDDVLQERLQRKRIYAQARAAIKNGNHDISVQKCSKLISKTESASALYTLASSYYNQQKYEQAEEYINKALKMRSKEKYKKLKFYIHMMKKQLEEAKKMLSDLKVQTVDSKIREMLSQLG